MSYIATASITQGKKALETLIEDIKNNKLTWNEAETRFQIIDRILIECLGWPKNLIRLEQPQGRKFSDYELGDPRKVIWEAKKEDSTFELPAYANKNLLLDLPSIMAIDEFTKDAILQAQGYCIGRGVDLAVVTNGKQIIAFFATRTDGLNPLDCKCLAVDGYDQFLDKFSQIWQLLSPDGIIERKLYRFLKVGDDAKLPEKISYFLHDYPKFRYPSDLQHSLSVVSELLLNDILDQEEIEKQFYEECYCESGALSQHALISKQMLSSRYDALFRSAKEPTVLTAATQKDGKITITPEVIASSIKQRPIVLIGDVGVGKTSFLKHLMLVSASKEFQDSIYLYINLGSQGVLSSDLNSFVLEEIENQLLTKYNVDIRESSFVRGVYDIDIKRFEKGIFAELREKDSALYSSKLMDYLEQKINKIDLHLQSCIKHLSKGRRQQIIIIIDNADQRDVDIQQKAFVIAQNFAREWEAVVFITVRPHTFFQSKKSGTVAAYPPRVFTIHPPRVDLVVEKRLKFALGIAEGRTKMEKFSNVSLNLVSISTFIKALLNSLKRNDLIEFLSNITGGNIREVIDFVTKFIGSPNVDAEKIIEKMTSEGNYIIPLHEFWKAALLGQFSHYDPQSSTALNLFDISFVNPNEHFLLPILLGFLNFEGKHKSKEGFVTLSALVNEMQNWGFPPNSTSNAIQHANNKKLIETSERVTYDEGEGDFYEEKKPDEFRLTTIGAYHIKRWLAEFSYLDAMSFDTPILDEEIRNKMKVTVNSFAIGDRFDRAVIFRSYLSKIWHDANIKTPYFDWLESVTIGQDSFDKVQNAIYNNKNELFKN